jgi:hypothetical protein
MQFAGEYSEHRNLERLAAAIGCTGDTEEEVLFVESCVSYVLKHQYGMPWLQRSKLVKLHPLAASVLERPQSDSEPAQSNLL